MSNENKELLLTLKLKDLIFQCISEYIEENPQLNMESDVSKEMMSVFIATYLMPHVEQYEDEISSLWFILDEMQNAERALKSQAFANEVQDTVQLQMAKLALMQRNKGDA